ncbi:two-component system response regulator [Congregibacter litoralis]|uniref:Response regulator receiver modulated diguanylate cyclase/phosphodiesterase n=1 Tax=Congregibacter litoralis KT71 TaxID=314285 RepID=A4A4X1_9GAMM|nr:GGDEF domain-containing response regulator [Congregibacter litoralis]EAQ98842.1 response regulator receiver modulated diguanylate cyclase/phosphodiesterase [Congregibacter litoralis KT71]
MKVLIVDDDVVDRRLIKRTLNSMATQFHEIREATSVNEGLQAIEEERFDVILLDYSMPEVDGIEMVIELRSKPDLGNTAIVMVSASEDPQLALNCIEVGAQDFIPKNEINQGKLSKAIVHARKRFEVEQRMHESYLAVKRMAERDPLTGLSNRYHFEEILKVMIATNRRLNNSVALLALDLDDFKNVNDTLGHGVGDQVLIEAVNRISTCLRENEGFARMGGDEFAIIIGGVANLQEVSAIANRILGKFTTPFTCDGVEISCGVSIGAALCPADTTAPNQLMKCADIAMYRSKQSGKNKICFYEARYQAEFHRRVGIRNEIGSILKDSGFRLFYQPIYDAKTSKIVGTEALVRWPEKDPSYGPDEFIPIAEESRMIDGLGKWVITTAIKQLAKWQETNSLLTMSINISPVQLEHDDLLSCLSDAITAAKVAPESVVLEITETAFFKHSDKISDALHALSQHGFKIALDDFGMGFSSIAHLMDYPIDIVKLDKSMQIPSATGGRRQQVLAGLALMLRQLNFEIVAEGIETAAQQDNCIGLELDKLQGFLLARPMPASDLQTLLAAADE